VARGTSIELGWEYPTGVVVYRDKTWGPKQRTPRSAPRMDHVTVAAADFDKTLGVYTRVLELRTAAGVPGLRRDWMGVDERHLAWVHGNGNVWINVVAPGGPAGKAFLAAPRFGDGTIVELAAEVADIDAFHDSMKRKGITMTGGDNAPLPAGAKALKDANGDRYCYFPLDKSQGMRILVFQRGAGATSVFARRDVARRH
jgi:catechol 2,3-dioxygenase-like lactoylglutathione lyase family enzyme